MAIEILEQQIESALNGQSYFLALFAALALPDIAAAIASSDGQAKRDRYIEWYEKWVRPRFLENIKLELQLPEDVTVQLPQNPFSGSDCYYYRCAMLHQGRSEHDKLSVGRVIFLEPDATRLVLHYNSHGDALSIDLPSFCREIVQGARLWRQADAASPNFIRNMQSTIQRYPSGLLPYLKGAPIIA